MITLPVRQQSHNYIDRGILPWIDVHFPATSSYRGRIFIGFRKKGADGVYNLSRRNIDELKKFIPLMHISQSLDYYITANAMSGVRRVNDQVFSLHNIVVDIDCHSADNQNTTEAVSTLIWRLSRDLWTQNEIPSPNSVVRTGRGVQLWWAIEPISVKAQYWYNRVRQWIVDQIQSVIADYPEELGDIEVDSAASSKLSGWFRLPFTYNTKTMHKGTLKILKKTRYHLQEILESYVPKSYNPNSRAGQGRGISDKDKHFIPLGLYDADVLKGCTSAMGKRVLQLVQLRSLRNAPAGNEKRDLFCFSLYCALRADHEHEEAFQKTVAFNAGFADPLPRSELEVSLTTAKGRKYKLTNEWIIDALEITKSEQQAIGMKTSASQNHEDKKQNKTRDMLRNYIREDRNIKAKHLFQKGETQSSIARKLRLSRNTVRKIIKDLVSEEMTPVEHEEPLAGATIDEASLEYPGTQQQNEVLKNGANKYVSYGAAESHDRPETKKAVPASNSAGQGRGHPL